MSYARSTSTGCARFSQTRPGRRRWTACRIAGVEPALIDVSPEDPIAYVLSLNLHRRHLSQSQLSIVADKAWAMYDHEAKERQREGGQKGGESKGMANFPEPSPERTARDQAGAAVGVSGKLVDAARQVREHGIPGPGAFPPAVGGVAGGISGEMIGPVDARAGRGRIEGGRRVPQPDVRTMVELTVREQGAGPGRCGRSVRASRSSYATLPTPVRARAFFCARRRGSGPPGRDV